MGYLPVTIGSLKLGGEFTNQHGIPLALVFSTAIWEFSDSKNVRNRSDPGRFLKSVGRVNKQRPRLHGVSFPIPDRFCRCADTNGQLTSFNTKRERVATPHEKCIYAWSVFGTSPATWSEGESMR